MGEAGKNQSNSPRRAVIDRTTKETQIKAELAITGKRELFIDTGLPFFNHMLHAFFFHGGFDLNLVAKGDLEVEPHHLVEDCGIVLGKAFAEIFEQNKGITRFASEVIPMDDSLLRAVVDYSGRAYLVYRAEYPQPVCGHFDMALLKEFFYAFTVNAGLNLHLESLYGDNSHHIAEGLFKATGRALGKALTLTEDSALLSTKGQL